MNMNLTWVRYGRHWFFFFCCYSEEVNQLQVHAEKAESIDY